MWFRSLPLLALVAAAPADAAAAPAVAEADLPLPFDAKPWSEASSPAHGRPNAIGAYSSGCLQGGRTLPPYGRGYQLVRPFRRRDVGHPDLLAFIGRLGVALHRRNLGPVMVGDLAQPRGGPAPTGHASHQNGLDVDLWYVHPAAARKRRLTLDERNTATPVAVVDLATRALNANWDPRMAEVLRLAAEDPAVDRIFVHPRIKKTLCESGSGQAWLVKVRPWWGHHDHFHVRLRCPVTSPQCQAQPPLEGGPADGCGAKLDWWFTPDAISAHDKRRAEDHATKAERTLPSECRKVLGARAAE